MKKVNELNGMDWLSDYMDNRLSAEDHAYYEHLIANDHSLQTSLATLLAARKMIRNAPKRSAPHNFTITASTASRLRKQRVNVPILRFSSVFSTALSLLIFVFMYIFNQQAVVTSPMMVAAPLAEKGLSEESASAEPQIIIWGNQGYGMGGGGGGDGSIPFGKGGGGAEGQQPMAVESAPLPEVMEEPEIQPEPTMLPDIPSVEPTLLPVLAAPPPADVIQPEFSTSEETVRVLEQPPLSGTGPILGLEVSPSEGISSENMDISSNETRENQPIWFISASVLLLVGIILGVFSIIKSRKIT